MLQVRLLSKCLKLSGKFVFRSGKKSRNFFQIFGGNPVTVLTTKVSVKLATELSDSKTGHKKLTVKLATKLTVKLITQWV